VADELRREREVVWDPGSTQTRALSSSHSNSQAGHSGSLGAVDARVGVTTNNTNWQILLSKIDNRSAWFSAHLAP